MVKRSVSIRTALVALAAAGVLAGATSAAQASDASIKAIIVIYNPKLKADAARDASTLLTYAKTGNSGPLRIALAAEVKDLNSLKSKVAAQSASSPRIKAGKAKFTSGIASVVKGIRKLSKAIGLKPVKPKLAKAEAKRADVILKRGSSQLRTALKLLS